MKTSHFTAKSQQIGIGEGLTTFALPHHRAHGSVHGGTLLWNLFDEIFSQNAHIILDMIPLHVDITFVSYQKGQKRSFFSRKNRSVRKAVYQLRKEVSYSYFGETHQAVSRN